jgi:hypothetical protein
MAVSWQREAENDDWHLSILLPTSMDTVYSLQGKGVYPPALVVDHDSDSFDQATGAAVWGDIADYMATEMNRNGRYQIESGNVVQFLYNVFPGHVWDQKGTLADMIHSHGPSNLYLPDPSGNGVSLYYDIWSNIHYGYVGAAAGYNATVLAEGQKRIGRSDAVDDLSVQIGIDLAPSQPPGTMTPAVLQQAIDDHMFEYLSAALNSPSSQVQVWR